MATSLDLLRTRMGVDAGPDLVVAVEALSRADLDELADELAALPAVPSGPAPQEEMWPLVNARLSTFATGGSNQWYTGTAGPAGLNLVAAIDPRTTGTGRFPAGVLRALLYCHGLVIEDPVLLAADLYRGSQDDARSLARRAVEAATASLVEIAPLVDSGVVETFFTPTSQQDEATAVAAEMLAALDSPTGAFDIDTVWDAFQAGFVDGLTPELRELWRRVRGGDRSPPLDLVAQAADKDIEMAETFVRVLAELQPRGVVENAVDVVARALTDVARHGGRCDLLCPSRLFAELVFVGTPDPRHAVRLHQLAEIEIPRLDALLIEDAVHIRQGSETFDLWRTNLSLGLERAHALQAELGPSVEVTKVVAEIMADARAALFREAQRSRWFGDHGRLVAFVAGALGGAIGGATGGPLAVALGGLGGLLAPIAEATIGNREPPAYLRRHYLLFDAPSPSRA